MPDRVGESRQAELTMLGGIKDVLSVTLLMGGVPALKVHGNSTRQVADRACLGPQLRRCNGLGPPSWLLRTLVREVGVSSPETLPQAVVTLPSGSVGLGRGSVGRRGVHLSWIDKDQNSLGGLV